MKINEKKHFFLLGAAGFLFLGWAVKLAAPHLIQFLFEAGNFSVLNMLTRQAAQQPLDFYLGMGVEKFFGPVFVVLTGAALLAGLYPFRGQLNGKTFGLAVFGYFLITRPDILFFPPYGDTVSGPLAEAWWLARHHFDYAALTTQPAFLAGGPKVYLFSIYPTFQALLLTFFSNPKWYLLINHVVAFAFGTITIVYFWKTVVQVFDKATALLLSVMLLSLPLFQSQVEQINMEMPLVMCAVIAVYFMSRKQAGWAALWVILATMVKGVGVLYCGALVVICGFLFFFGQEADKARRWRFFAAAIVTLLFVAAQFYAAFKILNTGDDVAMVGWMQGWEENKKLPVLYLSFGSALIFLLLYVPYWMKNAGVSFFAYLREKYIPLVFFVVVLAWYALFLQSFGAQYRYRLSLAPFSLFCVFYVLSEVIRHPRVLKVLLTITVLFSFWCAYGFIFKPYPYSYHSALERSLEYRNDIKVQMELAKQVEERFTGFTIAAPFTIAHLLRFPEFGFVDKPLDVMIYGFPAKYGGIKEFTKLQDVNIPRTIWIGFDQPLEYHRKQIIEHYPYGPEDKVIETIQLGDKKATLFFGGIYVERDRIMKERLLLQMMKNGVNR